MTLYTLHAQHAAQATRIFRVARGGAPSGVMTDTGGGANVVLLQNAQRDKRPFIHPIHAPDSAGELTENTPGHHLWQHGLYVGLNDVNGVGFWTEGLHEKNRATDGSFHPHPLAAPVCRKADDHASAAWKVISDWHSPSGEPMLTETQAWTLRDYGEYFLLDLDWTLTAVQALTFGKYPYGGLFLRMPFRKESGGTAINSAGQTNQQAEGQRARWVSVHMPIPGRDKRAVRECGIAMFDHPSNPDHPAPWRVDGDLGIAPSRSISGAWTLAQGASTTSRYRLYIFTGPTDPFRVEAQWHAFSEVKL